LVVEDNRDMREFICRVLEPDAHTRAVENGRLALQAISERVPDLVLSDMMMPEVTGAELLAELRKDEQFRDVPVVLLTAKADDDVKLNLLQDGAQDYVMKPFSVDELRVRVRNQLQTKRTRDLLRKALDTRSADLAGMVGELTAARSAAERANAAKDNFLAVLSHELRTPLTPALAAASALLGANPPEVGEQREYLGIIRRNIELEARLVDDLLDITRIGRDKLRIQTAPVDLHAILRDALAIADPALRGKKIAVVSHLDGAGPVIRGDSARLAQIFANILNNAAKFTPEAGQVTIDCEAVGDRARVKVSDTGIGIAQENLVRIFDPFRQAEAGTARQFGGLGLGLSIAKGLVEAHGGSIRLWSDGAARGTQVTVELPLPAIGIPPLAVESPASEPAAPARSLRILLVEDHEDTRRILGRLMTRWGHAVTIASTVAEARQAMESHEFDLMLSDLGLPDGSGCDVIAHLREKSEIPAVAMSGYGMETDLARTQAAGFNQHVIKPVSAEMLHEVLSRLAGAPDTVT
jgi:signal transduction histidine kinase